MEMAGYTQRGVAKGLKVPCLFMIIEVSIRCQKNPEVGIRRMYPRIPPQYTTGLEYEVPQSRLYCLCINVALCSTALQCICRVIRRSSMTMKAHTYYIIFGRPPIGGGASPNILA